MSRRRSSRAAATRRAPSGVRPRLNVWLENRVGQLLFGEGRLQILEAIAAHGSLTAAAEALGMSYRGLWAKLRHSERRLGFALVETHAGRGPQSGTTLTPAARQVMELFRHLHEQTEATLAATFRKFSAHWPPAD